MFKQTHINIFFTKFYQANSMASTAIRVFPKYTKLTEMTILASEALLHENKRIQ